MNTIKILSLAVLLVALGAAPSWAQQSPPPEAERTPTADALATLLADHQPAVDQQRAKLAALLSREDVRETAADRGMEIDRVEALVVGMSDAQVEVVSPLVERIEMGGGGGLGTVTIGVGLLIVILLVLILAD